MELGRIYALKRECLGNPAGTLGVVFNVYNGYDFQLIFPNGEYDGFSQRDVEMFLSKTDLSISGIQDYQFKNVMQLSQDFNNGKFNLLQMLNDAVIVKNIQLDEVS